MRDALSIFDRVVSYCGKNLTRQAVAENLNVLDFEYYIRITNMILQNNIPELLLAFDDILAKGFDGHHFVAGMASHFRNLMVCKTPQTVNLLEVGEHGKQVFEQQAEQCSLAFLLQAIEIANDADLKYKASQNQRLLVELCLMQLASLTFDSEKKKS
jgi:DNA polymerase-3 subunit gamma/tau